MSYYAGPVGMGLFFYPRGGSAQVTRYLTDALERAGCAVTLASGSLGPPGERSNATTFFGRDLIGVDYTEAVRAFDRGEDPMAAPVPIHPSFEDRTDVPDRVFARVSPALATRQVEAWAAALAGSSWEQAALFHLHHLTPMHVAVRRRWPDRPQISHLHGTELKFLRAAAEDDRSQEHRWPHRAYWSDLFVELARRSAHLICLSDHERVEAVDLLGVDADRVSVVPNGVETARFDRRPLDLDERMTRWRRWLVEDPQGWDESGTPGTIRYREEDLAAFVDEHGRPAPVLLYVGRFLGFKRVPLLIRAFAQARATTGIDAPLVIWGGSPGEWEGEHPYRVAKDEGVADRTFFVGWRGHDELPEGFACSDAMVAPSTDEPFGQVFLEAMASGVPVVATATGGPLSFVNTEPGAPNGWLVPPDDRDALASTLVEVVDDTRARRARADAAYRQIRRDYAWSTLAARFIDIYESVGAV